MTLALSKIATDVQKFAHFTPVVERSGCHQRLTINQQVELALLKTGVVWFISLVAANVLADGKDCLGLEMPVKRLELERQTRTMFM